MSLTIVAGLVLSRLGAFAGEMALAAAVVASGGALAGALSGLVGSVAACVILASASHREHAQRGMDVLCELVVENSLLIAARCSLLVARQTARKTNPIAANTSFRS